MKRLMYLSISVFFLALTLMVGVHIGQQAAGASNGASLVDLEQITLDSGEKAFLFLDSDGNVYYGQPDANFQFKYAVPKGNPWKE